MPNLPTGRTVSGMRTLTGVLAGFIAGLTLPASATIVEPVEPTGTPYHPHDTIGLVFLPEPCKVVETVPAEQHTDRRNLRPQVREVVVYRLRCTTGDKHRTVIVRGPWFPAFVAD